MKNIKSFYLHGITGAQTINLPEPLKALSVKFDKDSNGYYIIYERDDAAPKKVRAMFILREGDEIPMGAEHVITCNIKHVFSSEDAYIYQVMSDTE